MTSFIGHRFVLPLISAFVLLLSFSTVFGQPTELRQDTAQSLTLQQCLQYALAHEPNLNKALINIDIAKTTNDINLAGWLPQVTLSGSYTHYLQQPTTFINDTANPSGAPIKEKQGVVNNFTPQLYVSQAIFNPALLYACLLIHI